MDYYKQIFKRKSFHIFKDTEKLTEEDLAKLKDFCNSVKPLNPEIKTEIIIVPESETTCKRGGEYCILFYSDRKEEYLRNIGYIGEQIDLYLASEDIGALWFGIGKPKDMQVNGLDFVIMITIAKMPADKFRKDMFKSKRKPIGEIWSGDEMNIAPIVRFAPSACNTQPWITENTGKELLVYRYKKPGKRGIMPADKVRFYNKIDMGIYLFMLETCLEHENYSYKCSLYEDTSDDSVEKTLIARYEYKEPEKIFICALEKGFHYNFKCINCNKEYELITGGGRYGNLGPFECPRCNEKYYATIDDHQDPSLYVAKYGEHPSSMLDSAGKKRSIEIKYNGLGWY